MFRLSLTTLTIVLFLTGSAFADQLTITTAAYPSGMPGINYSALSSATGGTGPYTWNIASGTLPAGTTINQANGNISGTPAGAGRYSFTVQVNDSSGGSASKTDTIDIFPGSIVYDSGFNDAATAIATDSSGHVYVAGYSSNGTNNDYRTIKYATDGSILWLRSYDSGGDDQANAIAVDSGNNVYVAGSRMIVKYDQDGNVKWQKDFGGSANAVAPDASGNVYLTGTTGSYSSVIKKYDDQGAQLWSHDKGTGCSAVTLDEAGNVVLICFMSVDKYDPSGLLLWTKSLEYEYPSAKYWVTTDPTGNIYGTQSSSIFKLDASGNLLWRNLGAGAYGLAIKDEDLFFAYRYVNTSQVYYGMARWKTDGSSVWSDYVGGYYGFSYPAAVALNKTGDALFVTGMSAGVWGTTSPTDMRTTVLLFPRIAPITNTSIKPGIPFTIALKTFGGVPPYTYSSGPISADPATGVLSGTIFEAGTTYDLYFNVFNNGWQTTRNVIRDRRSIKLIVYGITTTSLPGATIGSSYSTSVSSIGGVAPLQWSIISGSLPPGISFDTTTGAISGIPTSTGTWNFTVQVTDGEASPDTAALSISVYQQLIITTNSLPTGGYGAPYNQTLAATGGKAPYTWTVVSGNLSSAFTLNSSTGVLSGTLNNTGTFNFVVQVKDANGSTTTNSYTLYIVRPLDIPIGSLPDITIGWFYRYDLIGINGVPPYTWEIEAGGLPMGLEFNREPSSGDYAAGRIAGTALAPGYVTFTVKITDAIGASVTRPFGINVNPMACGSTAPVAIYGSGKYFVQYPLPQNAYNAASSGDKILFQATELTDHLVFNKNINIVMSGGGDCGYYINPWYTVLHGDLTISAGTVEINNLIIM